MTEQLYALWDEGGPSAPRPSRLYHLAPVGMGTAACESLTSYVVRLAAAHHVSVQSLVVAEIRPSLAAESMRATEPRRLPSWWRSGAALMNGGSASTQAWVTALQGLTAWDGLAGMTMLRWANVVASGGLIHPWRRWCPACYTVQQQTTGVVYDFLLWAVDPVTWCVDHQQSLLTTCPHCQCRHPLLAAHAQPGHCFSCGQWLGEPSRLQTAPVDAGVQAWAVWVAQAAGDLIAQAPLVDSPPRRQLTVILDALIGRLAWQSKAALARLVPTHDGVVGSWRHGHALPQFENLIRLCACAGHRPATLLTTADVRTLVSRVTLTACPPPTPEERRTNTRHDWSAIGRELDAALLVEPPPSGSRISRQLKVGAAQLRAHFPERYQTLITRYREYAYSRSQRRQEALLAQVRTAVLQVHQTGVYPNLRRVAAVLPTPGMMRAPEARAAWRAMLVSLGWETRRQREVGQNKEA